MLVIIQKNLSGLGKSFRTRQVVDLPDEVAAEWCRIGYAIPAPLGQPEKSTSKIIPEVRDANPRVSDSGDRTNSGTSQPARGKKPPKG